MSDIDKALAEMVAMAEGVIAAKSRYADEAHWGYNNVEEFAYHARPDVIVALAKELARLRAIAAKVTLTPAEFDLIDGWSRALDTVARADTENGQVRCSSADAAAVLAIVERWLSTYHLTPADGGQ